MNPCLFLRQTLCSAILATALVATPVIFAGEPLRSGILVKEAKMDIVANGASIGFVKIPQGTKVMVLSTNAAGDLLIKRNAGETPFAVPQDSVSIEAPAETTCPTPAGPKIEPPVQSPAPSAIPAPIPTATVAPASRGSKEPSAAEVNKALGIPLFGSGSLWEENDAMVANRLRWPQESKTSREAGYRRYPYTFNSETRVLGARSLCLFLQGIDDKVARVSILFANKGDVAFFMSPQEEKQQSAKKDQPLAVTENMLKRCREAMKKDRETLEAALKGLFGDARPARVGRFATTAEAGQRWDWKGHTFMLVTPQNEYVALRIVPTTVFDDADSSRKSFAAAKATLSRRVERRENGDVLITDLPMVDQGRKGYCVPATFERVLRYYGLSEDMNVLAMAGQTDAGGGTSIQAIQSATYAMIRDAGGNITQKNFSGNIQEIKSAIDAGKPILFCHYSTEEFNNRVNERMEHRVAVTDWGKWFSEFLPSLKKSIPLKPDRHYSHICLIIGYNEKTREIAISDSWGLQATERWMTEEEARQIQQPGALSVIE
jgi:hypothetical protein